MDIDFRCAPAESQEFLDHSFDVITACQCFFYFDHVIVSRNMRRLLKDAGRILLLYMAWLPDEDKIAGASEQLVLKYNPSWSGCGERRHLIEIPEPYLQYFEVEDSIVYDLEVPFTKESWNGRMKVCRGIGASLSESEISCFEKEHLRLLDQMAEGSFKVLHYAAMTVLKPTAG